MAHTPGPWQAMPEHGRIVLNGSAIYGVADITGDYANWNSDDLRLMAAAPEMLAVLRTALNELVYLYEEVYPGDESDNDTTAAIDAITDVIAKAEGQGS